MSVWCIVNELDSCCSDCKVRLDWYEHFAELSDTTGLGLEYYVELGDWRIKAATKTGNFV